MTVEEKLSALRARMKEEGVDAFLVPTEDFHCSEYVGDYFKCRTYLTGFTGSAGTALVTDQEALLWTDGRYFIQAAQQLEGSGISLMKMGEPGVPTIEEYLSEHLGKDQVLSFDGRCMTAGKGERFSRLLAPKGARVRADLDLVGDIWPDRPALSCTPVWELGTEYTGLSRAEKIRMIRDEMKKNHCSFHIMTALDDIAWLLNLRGDDIPCNPVFMSYAVVTESEVLLFSQEEAFKGTGADPFAGPSACRDLLKDRLAEDHVRLLPYGDLYSWLKTLPEKSRVLLDSTSVNYTIWTSIPKTVVKVDKTGPALLSKAVKTPVEMENMRTAHIRDGVAVTRFMYWLKKRMENYDAEKDPETEISTAEKLESFRKMQPHYMGPSFDTISSWGYHAAIVHYSATEETDIPLQNHSFLLVDSGGQYLEGTTDITRTFVLGALTREEKEYFTRVLKGHLNLADCRFKYGCTGTAFDYVARRPLWEIGKDYNHGTGHGVGFCLNVHEGPNSFSYKTMQGRRTPAVFEEGMVTSDEPGFYLEGKFGIRHENLLLCRNDYENEYGRFMKFEYLTMVPFDLDGLLPELMTEYEIGLLNSYHAMVFEKISPWLKGDELEWLKYATRAI